MDINKEYKKIKERESIDEIKSKLKSLGEIEIINEVACNEIEDMRDSIGGLGSAWSNSTPVQGGGTSQEDRSTVVMDKIISKEKELKDMYKDYKIYVDAIESLDDLLLIRIIYQVWVYKTETIRTLAPQVKMSKTQLWRLSDEALRKMAHQVVLWDKTK